MMMSAAIISPHVNVKQNFKMFMLQLPFYGPLGTSVGPMGTGR